MNPPSCPSPPPLLLKGGRNFQIFGGEVATFLLLCSSILFTVCLCVCLWWKGGGGGGIPFITFWIFSLFSQSCKILIQVFIVLTLGIICTFLIHSGSLQKVLTALLTQFGIHRKVNRQFFECQNKIFLVLKRFQRR